MEAILSSNAGSYCSFGWQEPLSKTKCAASLAHTEKLQAEFDSFVIESWNQVFDFQHATFDTIRDQMLQFNSELSEAKDAIRNYIVSLMNSRSNSLSLVPVTPPLMG